MIQQRFDPFVVIQMAPLPCELAAGALYDHELEVCTDGSLPVQPLHHMGHALDGSGDLKDIVAMHERQPGKAALVKTKMLRLRKHPAVVATLCVQPGDIRRIA